MQNITSRSQPVLVIAFLLILFFLSASTISQADTISRPFIKKVDNYLTQMALRGEFSGTVMLVKNGEILLNQAFGSTSLEKETLDPSDITYRIGSITKQFTAMAILILKDRGLLDFNDSICTYLADCPDIWQKITIHHLLSHSSGIVDYSKLPEAQRYRRIPASHEQIIATFSDKPLEFEPGTNWHYSNSGYYLLGVIIEKISGQSYITFLEENIFKPVGMTNTGMGMPQAPGYISRRGTLTEWNPYNNTDFTFAAGALYSSVGDLLLWDRVLYTEILVKQETLDQMLQIQAGNYGYGWYIINRYGHKVAFHDGQLPGYSAYIQRSLDNRGCIVILSNIGNAPMKKIKSDLFNIDFGL